MMKLSIIKAFLIYEYFLIYRRPQRLLFMFFWPISSLLIWGYTSIFLTQKDLSQTGFLLIGAYTLWTIIYRAQQEISSPIFDKIEDRQLRNFLISPLTGTEYIIVITVIGLVKTIITVLPVFILALVIFSFNVFELGPPLLLLIMNLYFFGWILGLFLISLAFFIGNRASFLNIPIAGIIEPLSCVFFSRDVLPPLLKFLSWFIPSSYVFDNLRSILLNNVYDRNEIFITTAINLVYFLIACFTFSIFYKLALKKGILARI